MSYLGSCGYKNDVFVSYAHADNEPVFDSKIQWVSNFIDDLGKFLARKLGKKNGENPAIWIDHQLALNYPLNESLTNAIAQTATYLIIMSPAYLESEWCKKEREQFFDILRRKGTNTRVFIIEIDEIDRSRYPIEISEHVIPYKFWKKENESKANTLGFPSRSNDPEYSKRLVDISFDLAKELASIKDVGLGAPPINQLMQGSAYKGSVFLAQVTDDLEEKREEIKRYLKDEGYRILPEDNWYPSYDVNKLQQYIEQSLKKCQLYVQLISNLPGKKLAGGTDSVIRVQFETAKKLDTKMIVWRPFGINVNEVSDINFRQMHESELVQSGGFEEFKALLPEILKPVEKEPASTKSGFVYVCTDTIDRGYCEEAIIPKIKEKRMDYVMPLKGASNNVTVVRKFQEQNLLFCDAVVFVYCNSDPDIVFNQVMLCRKISTDRNSPYKIVAIYDGPPEKDKIDLTIQSMNFSYLNCRENVNEFVEKFLNIL